jgi:hypothetical protein
MAELERKFDTMSIANPNPDPRRLAAGFTTRELVDEALRRVGLAELRRLTGVQADTGDELRRAADAMDRELAR